MNKMGAMATAAAAVLVTMYLGATWYTGQLAQQRVDHFVAAINEQFAGHVRVVKRNSTPGMFSSVEDITLTIENPLLVMAISEAKVPREFTFHNVITHGPLPGLRTTGIARIETSLVLTDEVRTKLKDILGTDRPLAVAVTLGWMGSTRVDVTSPKLTVQLPETAGTVQWQGFDGSLQYSRDFNDLELDASLPGLKATSTSGVGMELVNAKVTGELQSKFETLYVGDEAVTVESIKLAMPANARTGAPASTYSVSDLAYVVKLRSDGEYLNTEAKMGAASYAAQAMQLNDIHFDFAMNHVHGPSAGKLVKAFQDYSAQLQAQQTKLLTQFADRDDSAAADDSVATDDRVADPAEVDQQSANPNTLDSGVESADVVDLAVAPTFDDLKPHVIAILRQKPELVLEHIGFASKGEALKISGRVQLDDVSDRDFEPQLDLARLIGKVTVVGDIQLSKGILATLSAAGAGNLDRTTAQFEEMGFLLRKGNQWEAHVEYKHGALTVNGKKLGR